MTNRHLVDPELLPLLDAFPEMTVNSETLPHIRAGIEQMLSGMPTQNEGCYSKIVHLAAGLDGAPDVPLTVYQPDDPAGKLAVILDIHGGGMVMGSAAMNDARNALFASECGCVVVSVDYRLAPETTAPHNVEDCYAALAWINQCEAILGRPLGDVIVFGESAGAGLAASLAIMARDRGEYQIAAQMLQCPMLDDRTGKMATDRGPYGEFVWSAASNEFGWISLLGRSSGFERPSPYAVPARAQNLSGLPPTFISIGALDLFLHESLIYAGRLADAAVPIELHVYPGAFHGFERAEGSYVAGAAMQNVLNYIKRTIEVNNTNMAACS
jgi:acetyl esterase/lipase